MKVRTSKKVTAIISIIAVTLLIVTINTDHEKLDIYFYLAIILMITALAINLKYSRCPNCHSYLREIPRENGYCPYCGKYLYESKKWL